MANVAKVSLFSEAISRPVDVKTNFLKTTWTLVYVQGETPKASAKIAKLHNSTTGLSKAVTLAVRFTGEDWGSIRMSWSEEIIPLIFLGIEESADATKPRNVPLQEREEMRSMAEQWLIQQLEKLMIPKLRTVLDDIA